MLYAQRSAVACSSSNAVYQRKMSGRDVRDILEIQQQQPPTSSSSLQPPRRSGGPPDPRVKRPDGITRELYALIGDNAPSLALAHTVKPKFKERIKRTGPSVKWQWTAFSNPSRGIAKAGEEGGEKEDKEREASRTLRLHHWVKDLPADHVVGAPDHKFAKFNTSSEPYSYTAAEYEAVPPGAFLCSRGGQGGADELGNCRGGLGQGRDGPPVCAGAPVRLALRGDG